jgi:non-heme chloroperoxidase
MADTIFMIHGMWVGSWIWDDFRSFFENRGYRCVAPTLRFHDMDPASVPDPRLGRMSLSDFADDLEEKIKGLLPDKPILMGHSMGGLIAQKLAARGLAKSAVLLTPAPPAGSAALSPSVLYNFATKLRVPAFLGDKPFRPPFSGVTSTVFNLCPQREWQVNYDRFVFESGRAIREIGMWFLDPRKASRVDASAITCPTLVVSGSNDKCVLPSVARRIAAKYRHVSSYKEFTDHAHMVLSEPGWQDVAAYVADWLESSGKGSQYVG